MVQEQDEVRKKRVLYIGSTVPLETAEGLEGVQKPLLERYPTDDDNIQGILCYLTIKKAGIAMQYVSDPKHILFFPISSLLLCAAVRCVTSVDPTTGKKSSQFVSLSHPSAGGANRNRPAIFTTITRRTEGRKVLECHGFVCSCEKDALELVESTSFVDRLSKGKINGAAMPASYETNTLKSTSASMSVANGSASAAVAGPEGSYPIHLVAGSSSSKRVAPEFYQPPPQHGYFYKTPDSQVKTYTVEKVMEGEAERLRAISPNAPVTLPRGHVNEPRFLPGGPPPPFMTLPHPQGRNMIPVRVMPPHPSMARPRFFSPPPPMMRPQSMMMPPRHMMGAEPYVLVPPPMGYMEPSFVVMDQASRRRRSHSSSRESSPSSSPGSPQATNGQQNGTGAGGSTDAGSRPHTPPTDYEKGPRVSRKEQFERQHLRPVNGDALHYGTMPGPGVPMGYPYGMFMMYPPRNLGYPPPSGMERARSVPPPMDRGMWKESKKGGKSKKDKKKKKSHKHRTQGAPSDVSTDSVGYTSEVGPGGEYPRMPRDFRRFENQFKHERAFSKSLKEEGSTENTGNAYSLNEHMAKRAGPDFNMY
ncbi:hypothetical protein ACOMHN_064586 [Nucella lapillus]